MKAIKETNVDKSSQRPTIETLPVEANPAITREAFADGLKNYNLRICTDRRRAVDHPLKECDPGRLAYPHLMLLDVNLPRLSFWMSIVKLPAEAWNAKDKSL
ncbi:MAG: hypothetical protein RIF32_11040 [Leptospirales bacterium]|jgi:hypothetical protein